MKEWLPDNYDPEASDINEVNEMLQEKNFGLMEWDD